jgi:hypothetical protein
LTVLVLGLCCADPAGARPVSTAGSLQRTVDPVVIPGETLGGLIGRQIENIRVFALRDGRALPVPFQVDERDSAGDWVWDVVYRRPPMAESEGLQRPSPRRPVTYGWGTVDDQDPPGAPVLDANDVLVLMAEDLGDRSATPSIAGAASTLEIEVTDRLRSEHGWAYVVWFRDAPPPLSERRYMEYNRARETVRSPLYEFNVSDDHPALIRDLRINDRALVERIRVRGEVDLSLPLPSRRIEFNEEDIHGYTQGYIAGPVRIVKRNIAHVSLSGGLITTRNLTCDHYYYPRHVEIPVCLSVRFPVREVAMTLTTDYSDPPFHRLYMGGAKRSGPPIAGEDSVRAHMHRLGREWIALESEEASLISLMVTPEGLDGHADSQPCLCRGRFESGGSAPGEETEAGFLLTVSAHCPRGDYVVYGIHVALARRYAPGDEDAALQLRDNRLTARVSEVASLH